MSLSTPEKKKRKKKNAIRYFEWLLKKKNSILRRKFCPKFRRKVKMQLQWKTRSYWRSMSETDNWKIWKSEILHYILCFTIFFSNKSSRNRLKTLAGKSWKIGEIRLLISSRSFLGGTHAGLFLINLLPPNEIRTTGRIKRFPNGRASLIGNRSDRAEDNSHGRTKGRDIRAWHRWA